MSKQLLVDVLRKSGMTSASANDAIDAIT